MATVAEALQIAVACHRANRLDEAKGIYARILEVEPRNPDALHLLGLVERRQGNPARAEELVRAALAAAPEMAEVRCNLGNLLSDRGDVEGAARLYRTALALQPAMATALYGLGILLCGRGGPATWAEAAASLRRLLRMEPERVEAHHDLGIALRQDAQADAAAQSQRRALALRPDFAASWMNLGNTLLELGRQEEAVACLRRALRLDPHHGDTLYNTGNALYAAGAAEEAYAHYARAVAAGVTLGLTRLASVLIDLGRDEEAEAALRSALTRPGTDVPAAIDMLSALLLRQNRLEEARAFFSTFTYPHADNPQAFLGECLTAIAESWLKAGDLDRAVATLAKVEGHGSRFFTVKSIACLKRALRDQGLAWERPANPDPSRPRISSSTLATHGRFAHNALEYILLRLYAETHGYVLETPDWVGGCFFDLNDPRPSGGLKPLYFPRRLLNDWVTGRRADPMPDVDILSPLFLYDYPETIRERVRSWLRPRPVWRPWLDPAVEALRARGDTVVALHIRRGDFVWFRYTITETAWYVEWLRSLWGELKRPVLYIATDDPATVNDFAEFSPVTLADLAEPWKGLEFLQDFHVLSQADILGVSAQSGFSQLAALLNGRARLFVEPDAAARCIRPYSPWSPAPAPHSPTP